MVEYIARHYDDLLEALGEHLALVGITLVISLLLAALLVVLCNYSKTLGNILVNVFSVVYSIPSLALFALLIPVTGLGEVSAIIVLVVYSQYLLLRNFLTDLNEVDPSLIEAATGMGMTRMQVLLKIRIPLAKQALFAGVRLTIVATIGIATIAASINAGGLGQILFDGLRTINTPKIIWGSIFAALLAVVADIILIVAEKMLGEPHRKRRRNI